MEVPFTVKTCSSGKPENLLKEGTDKKPWLTNGADTEKYLNGFSKIFIEINFWDHPVGISLHKNSYGGVTLMGPISHQKLEPP